MEIKLTKEEVDFIANALGKVQAVFVFDVLKLLEKKVLEAGEQKESEQKEAGENISA